MKTTAPRLTRSSTRNADETRARILAAARERFSRDSYENVGTRAIAGDAGVDAALVNRYFGGKESLFAEAIVGVFRIEDHLSPTLATLGEHLARQIMADAAAPMTGTFDSLQLLLRASSSPATATMVSARFHEEFVRPLAKSLRGRDADQRAALVASYVIGLATMKHALGSPLLSGPAMQRVMARAGAAIQACVDG